MIPWDTFKTPQDAYEHTQKDFRMGLGNMLPQHRACLLDGSIQPWDQTPLEFSTFWGGNRREPIVLRVLR